MRTLPARRHDTRAMGTTVHLLAPAETPPEVFRLAAGCVEEVFAEWEQRCSRFRGDSELTRMNRRAGEPTPLSGQLTEVVRFALGAAARTEGRFDPTVLDAVVAAGYDRDLDEVLAGARAAVRPPRPCGRWREVELADDHIRLPAGVGLDLGGVAKGWTVDLAADAALEAGLPWALVNAGGDLRLVGDVPAPGIGVTIEDPEAPTEELLRLVLTGGALASSSVTRRAWGPGLHHLIDPTTGSPASTDVLQATVWAPRCAEAEVLAKDTLLRGEASLGATPAVLVTRDGRVITTMADPAEVAA